MPRIPAPSPEAKRKGRRGSASYLHDCGHDEHHTINVELVSRVPYRDIERRFGVGRNALKRHSEEHIPQLLVEASEATRKAKADDLLEELSKIAENLERLSDLAEENEDYRTAISAQATLLKRVDLLARVREIIKEGTTVNILLNPQWIEIRTAMMDALADFPEARVAVAQRLMALEGGYGNGN